MLAYGDLKRVELAIALANAAAAAADGRADRRHGAAERIELMALAARLARERGIAVLFTEHDMDVVFSHADRIIVLNRGRLIAATGRPPRCAPTRGCRRSIWARGAIVRTHDA